MSGKHYTLVTTLGLSKIQSKARSHQAVNLTHMGFGGTNKYEAPELAATIVPNQWAKVPLERHPDTGFIGGGATIDNRGEYRGRWISNVGIYDEDGDLILIAATPLTEISLDDPVVASYPIDIYITLNNASNVVVVTDTSITYATHDELAAAIEIVKLEIPTAANNAEVAAGVIVTKWVSPGTLQAAMQEFRATLSQTEFSKTLVSEPAFRINPYPLAAADKLVVNGDIAVTVNGRLEIFRDGTIIRMDTTSSGSDYAIYAVRGELVVSRNFTVPEHYTPENSRRIGGFHYQQGFINDRSIWDLKFKPTAKDPRGMALSVGEMFWADIYLLNTTPDVLGTSAYNAQIATGGAPPKIPTAWGGNGRDQYPGFYRYIATKVLAAYGKRLPNQHEFQILAYGTRTGYAVHQPTTMTSFDSDSRSTIGCEQVSGILSQWGSESWDSGSGLGDYRFYTEHGSVISDENTNDMNAIYAGDKKGIGAPLFGGIWAIGYSDGIKAGDLTSDWGHLQWASGSGIAARGICDHLVLS